MDWVIKFKCCRLVDMEKYIQITNSGSRAIQTVEDAKSFIDFIDDYGPYVFRVVYLTEEEFNNLPEFTGF